MKYTIVFATGVIIGLCVCIIDSCTTTNRHTEHDTTIIDFKIKQEKPLPLKEWHVYNVEEEKICLPATWDYVKQNTFFFVSDLSKISPGSYFGVLKKNIKSTGYDATKYLKEFYSELKKDSTGRLTSYTVIKTTYQDKEVFTGEFHTLIRKEPYVSYSTIFERNGSVFDIALKIQESKAKDFGEIYQNIVYNFYSKDKLVFTVQDKVSAAKVIDLDKL